MLQNVINVSVGAENATVSVAEALKKVRPDMDNYIHFEKGVYHFYRAGSHRGFFSPSNNSIGEKDVVFPLLNMQNVTVDGNGSTFVFGDRVLPFVIQNSHHVVCKGFTIDFSFQQYCQAVVTESNDSRFVLSVNQQDSPYTVADNHVLFQYGSDTLSTKDRPLFATDMSDPYVPKAYIFTGAQGGDGKNMPARAQFTRAAAEADKIAFYYHTDSPRVKYGKNDVLVCGNDGRETGLFFAENSSNLRFEEITAYRGAGMGLIAQMCENITIDRMVVQPSPNRNDYVSITADILHFVYCTGQLTVRNCILAAALDDALNVHGNYTLCSELLSDRSVRLHSYHAGTVPFRPGDRAVFVDSKDGSHTAEAEVKSIQSDPDGQLTVTFADALPTAVSAGMLVDSPDRMPTLLFENNYVFDCPTIRISTSKPVIVRGNDINTNTHGIYISDEMRYWHEAGPTRDVLIENNRFGDRCGGNSITVYSEGAERNKRTHGKLCIRGNRFALPKERAMSVAFTEQLITENNSFACGC